MKSKNSLVMTKYLIIGLGNIGEEYANTRHNIGFDVVDALSQKYKVTWQNEKYSFATAFTLKGKKIILIKPTTYTNLSGKAVHYWLAKENIPIENSLTILDDIALPLNKLRIRGSGSDAGHNGLKDIAYRLQTIDYPRLRFGIGSNYAKGFQIQFVLGKWQTDEIALMQKKIELACTCIEKFVLEGLNASMNGANNVIVE